MAATVIINRWTGSGAGTPTDITGNVTRASTSDVASPGTADPVPIPAAGLNFSYWVSTRLQVTVAPAGTINGIRWFSDGIKGDGATDTWVGVECHGADASVTPNFGYRQATGTQGTTGLELTGPTGNHTGLDTTQVNVFGLTSGASRGLGGTITATTGHLGDFFVYQMRIGTTAAAGTRSAETFTFRFDET